MTHRSTPKRSKSEDVKQPEEPRPIDALRPREGKEASPAMEDLIHLIAPGVICDTERRGRPTPQGRSPREIVVDASQGFIPLWEHDTTLRWRFRERSMNYFANPTAAKAEIRKLLADALLAWGTASPVTFKYDEDLWDFEIVMRSADQCNIAGCVLASAFFPDGGRHWLEIYPKMFTQTRKEQVDTLIHEIGHIFGLRHFFANVSETAWPSEIFGRHERFSIMNYAGFSELTDADKEDLFLLYQSVWSGELTHINGTPIRLVKPYSSLAHAHGHAGDGELPLLLRPCVEAPSRTLAAGLRPRRFQTRANAPFFD